MHTKDRLADELMKLGLMDMSLKARGGYYDDFLSPEDDNIGLLCRDLAAVGTPEALALRARAIDGDFDGTAEESEAWAQSQEGIEALSELLGGPQRRKGE